MFREIQDRKHCKDTSLSTLEWICQGNVNVDSKTQDMTSFCAKEESSSMAGVILNVQDVRFIIRESVI
jgi:hypothetical protein